MGLIHLITKKFSSQKGNTVILVALLMTFLMGMAALAIDGGRMYNEYTLLRTAADAAALAGAQQLPNSTDAQNTALQLAAANGVPAAKVTITIPYNGDSNRMEVRCTKSFDFFLAPVLGFNNRTITARAVGLSTGAHAFDYALFSGSKISELQVTGATKIISGDVHTNQDADFNCPNLTIAGTLEAMGTITVPVSSVVYTQEPHSDYVPMPVWDADELKLKAAVIFNSDHTFTTAELNQDVIYYVNGDVHIVGPVTAKCSIVATDTIHVNGNVTLAGPDDAICLYSTKVTSGGQAAIEVESGATVYGILYAPHGEVKLDGNNSVNGAVVGDLVSIPGSNTTITHNSVVEQAVPQRVSRLVE
ncbi:MAG: pilus assembly protein TadG-related protein [Acidobacteriota bacterium]